MTLDIWEQFYVPVKKKAKTKVDAEAWANNRLRELGLHGKEGILQQSEITE